MNSFLRLNLKWFSGGLMAVLALTLLFLATSETAAQGEDTGSAWYNQPYYPPTATPTPRPPTPTPTPALEACQIVAIVFDQDQYELGDRIGLTTHLADSRGTPLGGAKVTATVEKETPAAQASTGLGFVDRIGEYDGFYDNTSIEGAYTFTVTATDPNGARFLPCTASDVVLVVGPSNNAPTVTTPGNQTDKVGDSVNLPLNATDPDGDALTFSATGLPAGLSLDSATGVIAGTLTAAGTSNVTVTVNDGNGGSASTTFTWQVDDQQATSALIFDPSTLTITPNGRATNAVVARNINDLTTMEIEVTFDPAVVQVVDADSNVPGVQVKLDPIFRSGTAVVAENEVDNTGGSIRFAGTLTDQPISDGTLFEIDWQATGAANDNSPIRFSTVRLFDSNADTITLPGENGTIEIGTAAISGYVTLQGRSNSSGVEITSNSGAQAQTDASGFFSLASGQSFTAAFPGYLSAQASTAGDSQSASLGTITLLAGDVNNDDVVNILDLAYIARSYQSADSVADLNGDGWVDILDIALAANNYAKAGPLGW